MAPPDPPPADPALAHRRAEESARDAGGGLRERKKRMTRQLLSDTATAMFLRDGFDAVRVADVAAACGVSEKTVYNYFPTKESLILDRFEDIEAAVRRALGPESASLSPVAAAVAVINDELERDWRRWMAEPAGFDPAMIRRFSALLQETPALRMAQRLFFDRMIELAAAAMAERAGVNPEDPEPQAAAHAILALWAVQYRGLRRYADGRHGPQEMVDAIRADVERAARLIDTGLWSFGLAVQGAAERDRLPAAIVAANAASQQVLTAVRQARRAWRRLRDAGGQPVGPAEAEPG